MLANWNAITVVAFLAVGATTASAQKALHQRCASDEQAAADACTKLIDSGDYSDRVLSDLYNNRCSSYISEKKYERALEDCNAAIKINRNNDIAFSNRAIVKYNLQRLDETIEDASSAIRLNRDNYKAYNERANAWSDKGEHDKAMRDYTEGLRIRPGNPVALNNRCDEFALLRQFETALRDCNESLSIRPNHLGTTVHRAIVNVALGRADDAARDFGFVLEKESRNATALFLRGLIKKKRGDTASGDADIAAARERYAKIDNDMAKYGLAP